MQCSSFYRRSKPSVKEISWNFIPRCHLGDLPTVRAPDNQASPSYPPPPKVQRVLNRTSLLLTMLDRISTSRVYHSPVGRYLTSASWSLVGAFGNSRSRPPPCGRGGRGGRGRGDPWWHAPLLPLLICNKANCRLLCPCVPFPPKHLLQRFLPTCLACLTLRTPSIKKCNFFCHIWVSIGGRRRRLQIRICLHYNVVWKVAMIDARNQKRWKRSPISTS